MIEIQPLFLYLGMVLGMAFLLIAASSLFPSIKSSSTKFMPYESGIKTETNLLKRRFPLKYYLVALIFLIFDVEVIFLYPWAVISKKIGPFAFYEMTFFIVILFVGFAYVWKKGGLDWE